MKRRAPARPRRPAENVRRRGLPGERRGDEMGGVEVRVVRELRVVLREESMERRRVVRAEVLVAESRAEVEVLPVHARAQRERTSIPVLEAGAQVRGHTAELELRIERTI